MARPLRLQVPGGVYHVVSRGNAKQEIFLNDDDRQRFLAALESVIERLNVLCHAYCLMNNHYHLLLETPEANLSTAMRNLNGTYAQGFNRRHGRVGHLFQGRFKSHLVERETYLLVVCRYIVLNPVRGNLVPTPSDWIWSSYRAQAGQIRSPHFLTVDWLLSHFHAVDRSRAQAAYRRFVQDGLRDQQGAVEFKSILGSEPFVAQFREILASRALSKEIPRVERFAARPTLRDIFAGCSERQDRDARIREAHVTHAYTMREIADHLGLHPMTISRAVRTHRG
jgi:REP element-mobilizing transposase RayT